MAGRDRRRRQQGMVALHLAVGPFSPQAVRTNELLRAEILAAVPADQDSVAKPREGLAQRRRAEQLLHALETWLQQHRIGGIKHVTDIIVGGDFPGSEQGQAIRPPMAFLQGALECQKRGALHEKQGKRRKPEVRSRCCRGVPSGRPESPRRPCAIQPEETAKAPCQWRITSPLIWESRGLVASSASAPREAEPSDLE
jgi:hypothetical protein